MMLESVGYSPKEQGILADLRTEIAGVSGRISEYFQQATLADLVVVVVGCDDSREAVPQGLQRVDFGEGEQRAMFHLVPAIGGGVSAALPRVIKMLEERGVERTKIRVITTQHGNSTEVNATLAGQQGDIPTCGLRGVLHGYGAKIDRALGKNSPFGQYRALARLSRQAGIPVGLLRHAGKTNFSADMGENGAWVHQQTMAQLNHLGIPVWQGYYDHQGNDEDGKSLHVFMDGSFQTLKMPDLQAWPDGHQDPQALVVSVGRVAAAVPDGVLLPQTVGGGGTIGL